MDKEKKMPTLGLVITQKNEAAMLNLNIEYHRYMGVRRFYIFDYGSEAGSMQTIKNKHGVAEYLGTDFACAPAQLEGAKQKALDGNWIGRQLLNTYKALQEAKKDGVDWLIFIDADELVFIGSEQRNAFLPFFAGVEPDVEVVFFKKVYEAVPQEIDSPNHFKDIRLFKTTAYHNNAVRSMHDPISGKRFAINGFFGPAKGKQAARVGTGLIPKSSHSFFTAAWQEPKTIEHGQIMHYHLCGFADFKKKSSIRHPNHYVFGSEVPYYPKIFWRELVLDSGKDDLELRDYFRQNIMLSNEEITSGKHRYADGEPFIAEIKSIGNIWDKIEPSMSDDIKTILLENHKVAFTILSKNACTSTKAHIAKTLGLRQTLVFPEDVHFHDVYDYPFVSDGALVSSHASYLRFCIIRNPWSRLVSCFKDKIKPKTLNNHLYKEGVHMRLIALSPKFKGGMAFEDFVEIICSIPDSEADEHFRSQAYDIVTLNGELRVNYIAKLENLHQHFAEITRLSGLSFEGFPVLNTTEQKKPYTEYYSGRTIEKVRKRYAADIGLFGYSFDGTDSLGMGKMDAAMEEKIKESVFFPNIMAEKNKLLAAKKGTPAPKTRGKIFCIGLNKTGTRSLAAALNMVGVRSAHHTTDLGRIGEIFKHNQEQGKDLLRGLENFDAFLDWIDMEGTNNDFFKIMDAQYPGSKFIFSDRDIDGWVKSRIKHVKRQSRLGAFQKAYPESVWYNMNTHAWEAEYHRHKKNVLAYFEARAADLLVFNVFEGDAWEKLCAFLEVPVPKVPFPARGKSDYTEKTFIHRNFLLGNVFLKSHQAVFYFLPGGANLAIKASLTLYVDGKRKFEFPENTHLVNEFPFPSTNKLPSDPSLHDFFRFTLVRNPWDRLVACYTETICSAEFPDEFFEKGANESFNEHGDFFYRNMPFATFIERVCAIPESQANRHFCSQIYQLTSGTGELLVNYERSYENLKKQSTDLMDHSRISLYEIPPEKGTITDTAYTKFYSDALRELVQKKFAADIELFGYEFGVPLKKQTVDYVSDGFYEQFTKSAYYPEILKENNKRLDNQINMLNKELNFLKEKLSGIELHGPQSYVPYDLFRDLSKKEESLMIMQKTVGDIHNSLSWKITKPLRQIGNIFQKLKAKD